MRYVTKLAAWDAQSLLLWVSGCGVTPASNAAAMDDDDVRMEQLRADVSNRGTIDGFGDGTLPLGAVTLPGSQKGMTASNPFIAELGLLTKLLEPRVSGKKDAASLPAPKPVKTGPGGKRQSVPPLSDSEVANGEVQSLPGYGKMWPGQSSTAHAGLKEMQISRKARHEAAIETYQKRLVQLEVELEGRTGQVARGFKQLISLNDAELATMFEELSDDFLLQMERVEVDTAWVRIYEELKRREGWTDDFEQDLSKVRRRPALPAARRQSHPLRPPAAALLHRSVRPAASRVPRPQPCSCFVRPCALLPPASA